MSGQPEMVSCTRCCVQGSMRVVNLVVTICGVGMIIYSLWLLKMWQDGVAELPSVSPLPRPWFIYTCLGAGIAVSLSTLAGHMVAHCISNYTMCIYIVSICSLLFLEIAVIVTIFFNMDWELKIDEYIDGNHQKFRTFLLFHLNMCRFILIMILVPQIYVIVLAVVLWAIGTEPRGHGSYFQISDFSHSFLLGPTLPLLDDSRQRQICRYCRVSCTENPIRSFLSYIKGVLRMRFQGRTSDS